MRINDKTEIPEQYYTLWTNLGYALDLQPEKKVVMFGTSENSDITTALIVKLALLNAKKGTRTLINDSNFDDSDLQNTFGIKPKQGWTDLLKNNLKPGSVITETIIPNLSVLSVGSEIQKPMALISQSNVLNVIKELKLQYDIIFLNVSSFFTTTVPQLLLQVVDTMAIIVVSGETQQHNLLRMINTVRMSKTNILGLIEWQKG